MTITIIGYRGSGKTSLANPLAKKLGWNAIDSDDVIEEEAGKSIREIFEDDGEPHFRKLEKEVMKKLLEQENLIIAAGGGAILDEETRNLMKKSGPVIWLQASVEELSVRISGDSQTNSRRPDLTPLGIQAEIEKVLKDREPFYQGAATIIIDTTEKNSEEIALEAYQQIPS